MRKEFLIILFFLVIFLSAIFLFLPKGIDPNLKIEFILKIRLPEIFAAVFVGSALAIAGLTFQNVLRNDLADPYILGLSGGSCFGVTLAILFMGVEGGTLFFRIFSAFVFGLVSLLVIMRISGNSPERLLILGVIANIFFATLSRVLTLYLKPSEITTVNYFLLGFISPLTINELLFAFLTLAFLAGFLYYMGDEIDILSFSDEESQTIGVNVIKTRTISILISSFISSLVVSIAGMVGFIGLIVPHISRLFSLNKFKNLFFTSLFSGSTITLVAYIFSKLANTKVVVSIGLYVNLFGILFFIYLFLKKGFSNGS